MDEERSDAPLYHVKIVPHFHEESREYSVSIDISGEENANIYKQLFMVSNDKLEDPLGREIDHISDLRKSKMLIDKIIKFGHKHLPKSEQ